MGLLDIFRISEKESVIHHEIENGATIVDVRTQEEFKLGHVKGAINIPLSDLNKKVDRIKTMKTNIILCCASGMRSGKATSMLKKEGINCYNGGAWKQLKYWKYGDLL